jgi:hypothetical protein
MKNLSLVSSIQIHIVINNKRKEIYKFATMILYRSQQQAPCATLCFIITNILLRLYKTYETRVFWSLHSVQVIPHIRTCNNQTAGSESLTVQYKLVASVGSILKGTAYIYIYIYIHTHTHTHKVKLIFLNESKLKSQVIFSINQLALKIFPDMGKEGKDDKEIT